MMMIITTDGKKQTAMSVNQQDNESLRTEKALQGLSVMK